MRIIALIPETNAEQAIAEITDCRWDMKVYKQYNGELFGRYVCWSDPPVEARLKIEQLGNIIEVPDVPTPADIENALNSVTPKLKFGDEKE
jgi:hypothetical protein